MDKEKDEVEVATSRCDSKNSFCCRKDYDGNETAKGFVLVSAGRGPGVIYDALFSVVAFNAFAVAIADCDGTILGGSILHTSAVATLATIEGVVSPILSPFLGGVADTTPNRKLYLGVSFGFVCLTLMLQGIFYLSTDTTLIDPSNNETIAHPIFKDDAVFILVGITILVNVITYEFSALLTVSYSPELTTDDKVQMGYIADSYAANNGSQLAYLIIAFGITTVIGSNSLETGSLGAFICTAYCTIVFYYGYCKLEARRDIDEELSTKCCGVPQLLRSIAFMATNYSEVLKYLVSWMCVAAAVSNTVSLATTYFQTYLGYAGGTVSLLLGIALVMSVPGSLLSRVWTQKLGFPVKKVYIAVSVVYAIIYFLAPILLVAKRKDVGSGDAVIFGACDDPFALGNQTEVPIFESADFTFYMAILFVVLNGLCLGHIYPLNTQFYALLIPGGEENIYFGIKVTFSKLLTWLPPLVFLTVSEVNNGDLQFALLPLGAMFIVGAGVAAFIDVDKGKRDVEHTLKFRQGAGKVRRASVIDRDSVAVDLSSAL